MNKVSLTLGSPIVISQASPDIRRWGPWQFPTIERISDGRLHARFHISADSAASYGNPVGHAVSDDNGKTWTVTQQDKFSDGVLCDNKDRIRIKMKPSVKQEDLLPAENPIKIIISYGREIRIYRTQAFPPELGKWYFERMKAGDAVWVEETAAVNIPHLINWTADGVIPRNFFWRLRKDPCGNIWGITYIYLCKNDTTLRTCSPLFCISKDNGHTFNYVSHIEYQPDPATDRFYNVRGGFYEPDITFAPDGSVFCLMRTSDGNGIGPMYWCRSTDGGKSWTKPAVYDNLGVWSTLLTLKNGVTLAGYGRPGLYIRATSDPACLCWDNRIDIVPPKECQKETCSYCDLIELDDNAAYIIYSDFNYPNPDGVPVKSIMGRRIEVNI